VASFIRKVPTASGARAVQIVHKRGRLVVGIEHIGSAHDDAELAVLVEVARQRLHAGPRVSHTGSQLLWDVLGAGYTRLGFDAVGDEAFRALVLADCGADEQGRQSAGAR
jgi:hypothetical protein